MGILPKKTVDCAAPPWTAIDSPRGPLAHEKTHVP